MFPMHPFTILVEEIPDSESHGEVVGIELANLAAQLLFFSLGLLISLLAKRIRSVTPWSLGLAFGTYVISGFSGILEDVKLEYLSPFKHFDPGQIIKDLHYDTRLVILDVVIIAVAIVVSYWLYQKRDIASPS